MSNRDGVTIVSRLNIRVMAPFLAIFPAPRTTTAGIDPSEPHDDESTERAAHRAESSRRPALSGENMMQVVLPADKAANQFGFADRRPFDRPAGAKLFVPGWPQWCWRQRERAIVLVGSFLLSLSVGVWAWGTWLGWTLLAFAFF